MEKLIKANKFYSDDIVSVDDGHDVTLCRVGSILIKRDGTIGYELKFPNGAIFYGKSFVSEYENLKDDDYLRISLASVAEIRFYKLVESKYNELINEHAEDVCDLMEKLQVY